MYRLGVSAVLRENNRKVGSPLGLRAISEKGEFASPNSYAGHPPASGSWLFEHSGFSDCCTAIDDSAPSWSRPSGPYVRYRAEALRTPRMTSAALRRFRTTKLH